MKKFSILYVDDEQSNLRVFKDTFRRKFNIYTAASAKEGIEVLENNQIDLVLSDQRMPEMTGVEFLKYSLKRHPEPNRILITGYTDFNAIENAINDARIFQYVQKPWDEKELDKIIDNALKIYDLEQENKRQKNALVEALEKAKESDRLKTAFLANISHEIRTPMNAIIGFSNFLKDEDLTEAQKSEYIDIVNNSCYQLLGIINDVVEASKIDAGLVKVKKEEIDINKLFEELYSVYQIAAENKNLKINKPSINLTEPERILIDKVKLRQILDNLLDNAIKFTKRGSIDYGYKIKKSTIEFFVKDTGIGISKKDQETIFERFNQADEDTAQLYGGTGLGLTIANAYASLMNGKLWVESQKDKGSTFFIELPYGKTENKKEQTVTNENSFEKELHLLIVEDNNFNYKLIAEIFQKMNVHLLHAATGNEAIDIFKNNDQIDLVLMDIKLPDMSGHDVTKKLKELNKNIPIIAQTAYAFEGDKEKALQSGCVDYLSKPIKKDELITKINKHIKKD
jgi:signal transduction histidine kinase